MYENTKMWTHRPLVLTNPLPDLPLSSSNSQHSPGHEAWRPCLLLMYANVLHPSVPLLNLDFTCFQPCSCPSYSTVPLSLLPSTPPALTVHPPPPPPPTSSSPSCHCDIRALDRSQLSYGQGGVRGRRPFLCLCKLALFWLKDSCIFHLSPKWRWERQRHPSLGRRRLFGWSDVVEAAV